MEFLSGVKEKEIWELSALLAEDAAGRMVKTNGAVHAVRDMGSVAFVMLRKREGLLQCVLEKGENGISAKDFKEGQALEVC